MIRQQSFLISLTVTSASCNSTQSLLKDGTIELERTGRGVKLRAYNLRFSYTSSREVGNVTSRWKGHSYSWDFRNGWDHQMVLQFLLLNLDKIERALSRWKMSGNGVQCLCRSLWFPLSQNMETLSSISSPLAALLFMYSYTYMS